MGAANSACSLPPCGGGVGRGVVADSEFAVTPLPVPPPPQGRSRPSSTGYGGRERCGAARRIAIVAIAALAASLSLPPPSHAAEPPRHVVSFNVCADQLVVALADPAQIAALSPHATNELLSTVTEKARAFPRTGWTAESVVPFEPDLVLMGYSWDRSPTLQMMRALGLRLAPIGLVDDFDGALAQIHDVAALLGRPERGEALAAEIAAARRRLANARRSMSSTALLVAQGGYTVGPTSLAAALMKEAGLAPPAGAPSGYGGYVPLERLMTLRPDYLVMASPIETPDSQGALYLTHPALRALYPPERRIILPTRYTLCGGPSLVAGLNYITEVVTRLSTGR
jgi:iron complex transport system substrate-binding protein